MGRADGKSGGQGEGVGLGGRRVVKKRRRRERWDAPVTEAEKESLLWQMYATEDDRRSKYIPAEYSDIILG